jgi:hypothetical protein
MVEQSVVSFLSRARSIPAEYRVAILGFNKPFATQEGLVFFLPELMLLSLGISHTADGRVGSEGGTRKLSD